MKIRNPKSLNAKGFTLIELLIYIAIFSTLIGAIVALAVLASSQKVSSLVTADINYQGEATMAYITQTVHQATSISSPAAGNSASTLNLVMPVGSVNPTIFSTLNDGTTTRLRVQEGAAATSSNLTNSHATVSGLTFTNMSLPSTKGSVQIKFTLTYRSSSVRQEYNYSKVFYGAATIP